MFEKSAERLRMARERAGFATAADAARANGWPEGAYRHHENGTRNVTTKAAARYAKAFNVSTAWLLGLGDDAEPSYAENLQITLYDGDLDASGDFHGHLARKYGVSLIHRVDFSQISEKGILLDGDQTMAFDAELVEKIAPGRSVDPLSLIALTIDIDPSIPSIREGAVVLVNKEPPRIRQQGQITLYVYAGIPAINRLYYHADNTFELLDESGGGTAVRMAESDVAIFGHVLWVGQSVS